jgi:hypothetical protein
MTAFLEDLLPFQQTPSKSGSESLQLDVVYVAAGGWNLKNQLLLDSTLERPFTTTYDCTVVLP